MKRFISILFPVVIIGLMIAGCMDEPAPTGTGAPETLAKVTDAGGYVVNTDLERYVYFYDYDAGYIVYIGIDVPGFCNNIPGSVDTISYRGIYLPEYDSVRTILYSWYGKDLRTYVYPYPLYGLSLCYYISLGNPPVASGLTKFSFINSDYYSLDANSNNAKIVVWKANGTLYTPEGNACQLNLLAQYLYPADSYYAAKENIKIQLTMN